MSHRSFLGNYNKCKNLSIQCTAHGQDAADSVKMVQFVREEQWQ